MFAGRLSHRGDFVKVKVWSVMAINEKERSLIRNIMKTAINRDRSLANAFPQRFRKRKGNELFFDAGKRRYMELIEYKE